MREVRTYAFAALFIAGNIVVPQLCHALIPKGGLIFLPIYFFTLIGAYKYGAKVGVLTALLSPIINSIFFEMPAPAVLPILMMKGVLLAGAASLVANRAKKVSILALLAVVLMYQVVGCSVEWAVTGSFMAGVQDFRLGIPGMLIQVFGGWAFIKYLLKK
ncbi:MAG: ECF transporter S component [Bacteroidales bacterium]|nr:ECF transporter S component [Bacteroidales bacterium]